MFTKIDHVELIPSDVERTIRFYTDIFGFTIKSRFPVDAAPMVEVIYLELNGSVVELLGVTNPAPAPENPWHVGYNALALTVDNMEQTVEFLKSKGVAIAWGPVNLGDSIRAEIRDPDGLTIELRQW
ncbi:MAG: VOC family protein [Armatimonadota bacterium]